MFLASINGIYGIGHIIYLITTLILIIGGAILIKKYVKNEKTINTIIKISAVVLLITIIINRISITYTNVVVNQRDGYTWLNLIPDTYCGLASIVLSLTIIFGKKDHIILHFISYIGFFGGLITMFYPDFLNTQTFFDLRSITGILHHTIMVWIIVITMLTRYIVPSIKKWCIFPIGLCIIMTIGILEIDMLGFEKGMQIGEPLLASMPKLTAWYTVLFAEMVGHFIYLLLYEILVNKKTFKQVFQNK